MQSISKSKLKANMLRIFRELEDSGGELIVTDRGRPVLRIQPVSGKKSVEDVFGAIRAGVIYYDDIDLPTIDEWTEA
ncbi:MAG: prevent-host-death protein [Gemmatimonadota bacterium]|nr:prevent-host-death protein [Gemmatimonadota bacterium]